MFKSLPLPIVQETAAANYLDKNMGRTTLRGGQAKKIPFELALTRRRKLRTSGHVECSYGFGYGAAISEELLFPLLNRGCCLLPQGNADYQGNQR